MRASSPLSKTHTSMIPLFHVMDRRPSKSFLEQTTPVLWQVQLNQYMSTLIVLYSSSGITGGLEKNHSTMMRAASPLFKSTQEGTYVWDASVL